MNFSANCSFYSYKRDDVMEDREPDLDSEPSSPTLLVNVSIIKQLTSHLAETYGECDPNYDYDDSKNPRRELTKVTEQLLNEGYDNSENDLLLNIKDVIISPDGVVYKVLDLVGAGTFG